MVRVLAEDPLSSARRLACTALVTYVSVDRRQLPFAIPGDTESLLVAFRCCLIQPFRNPRGMRSVGKCRLAQAAATIERGEQQSVA
jgi:acyl-CoA hydrolase